MMSLSPGILFQSSGLNQVSIPTNADSTPSEIEEIHKKMDEPPKKLPSDIAAPYNGNPWPRDSPVAMVYDVSNSSTKLILLNNKSKSNTRLRGQGPLSRGSLVNESGETQPNPERHFVRSNLNMEKHRPCLDSSSPYFEPREAQPQVEWKNRNQRPPWKPGDSSVNTYRHVSCRTPTDPLYYSLENQRPSRPSTRPCSRKSHHSSRSQGLRGNCSNLFLHHPDLSYGQRSYLMSTAHVYSLTDLKSLKQKQYLDLLFKERQKGYHSNDEYYQYDRFIRTPRKLTSQDYVKERPTQHRPQTAHGRLQKDKENKRSTSEEKLSESSGDENKSTQENSAKKGKDEEEEVEEKQQERESRDTSEEQGKKPERRPVRPKTSKPSKESRKKVGRKKKKRSSSANPSKREPRSAHSVRPSSKGPSPSSKTRRSKKAAQYSDDDILSSDPDTRDKRGDGPTHVNVDVSDIEDQSPSKEPRDREPNNVDKLEY